MRNWECGIERQASYQVASVLDVRSFHSAFRIPNSAFPCASPNPAGPAYLELRLQSAHRAPAHEYPELPRLHNELHILVVEPQLLWRELEVYRARFTRLEGDPTESG